MVVVLLVLYQVVLYQGRCYRPDIEGVVLYEEVVVYQMALHQVVVLLP